MRALSPAHPSAWFKVAAGKAAFMQPGADRSAALRRKALFKQLRLMHFGQASDRYRPSPAMILERDPKPGTFYRPRTGITPWKVAQVAYGKDSAKLKAGLMMMNRSTWNDHIRRARSGWQTYKVDGLQFDHKYDGSDPLSTYGSGTSFPVVWIPPFDGREPEQMGLTIPIVSVPSIRKTEPKPIPAPVVIKMPTLPIVGKIKKPILPPVIVQPKPIVSPVVYKPIVKPIEPYKPEPEPTSEPGPEPEPTSEPGPGPQPITSAPIVATPEPLLPSLLPRKEGKESFLLSPKKKKTSIAWLIPIALIASEVL